ncbi:type I restriction enzyme endonuclease domain-containing protein [Ralstonia mannitolilytica]|uniref:type I restriction enzyme endonuclease domain-containing protein n=1 Tax=Ralstonia mannitolilytica TaxID=105219 RepID=UPI0026F1A458|nr:type I restriction enzyme endonuclease domain-containing protein [Ralstonia mannitolilytica]
MSAAKLRFQVDSRLATLLSQEYTSTERALKELVDNAWDADADQVSIQLPKPLSGEPIVIRDDGTGMTEEELRRHYLTIAKDRRSVRGERTAGKNRQVKGRKGIGKFAGFMVASVMTLETRTRGNAITTAEVLQELIQLAKDIRAARQRGEESGLSDEEIAFYDALAENESAVQVMGDDKLRVIAHELLVSLRENVSVDWAHRESARARMRVLVKRILRKYGYPPDLQDAAVQTVLQQAEALSSGWSVSRGGMV